MTREYIRLVDIHKSFGAKHILEGINLRIDQGDRIGIVGHNGSGKTTLLNTISEQNQDIGEIIFSPGLRIAFLTQIRDILEDSTLEEELNRRGRQFSEIESEISEIESKMEDPTFYEGDWESSIERYQELQSMITRSGGTDVSGHAQNVLKYLGLGKKRMDVKLSELSGGERAKVALARQLVGLDEIDVLLLDEPTNHLDLRTINWLENFISKFKGTILVVSHDRYFLDLVCNNILEIRQGGVWGYKGNYSSYIKQKELFLQTLDDRISKNEKEVKRITGALQSMKRANKYDKSISQKHHMLMRTQRELKWLKSIKPRKRKNMQFNLKSIEKSSIDVISLENVSLHFDSGEKCILNNQTFGISRGQRIGILGPNGAGKTTLLNIILGKQDLDSGHIELSKGVEIGYFHQDHRTLDFSLTPIEQIQKLRPKMEYGEIRALLGRFQFSKEMVNTKLKNLSGGERARIAMLKLLLDENNLLLLDEPTNHLDTDAKEALEDALASYGGTLVIVSHDRWFLDQLCDTIWNLDGLGSLEIFPGNYSDFAKIKLSE
ncbi:MAG: hypothetical protein CMB56_006940 [Methanobacteriota archaeon]|nr:MAG: hypothetical protein CMB56_006940 [Euryarchaeota archaeon]|tara:strand:+ start:3493 stop:5139 length:1647 start_codon:yes stop_codon:yes gene_type:complete